MQSSLPCWYQAEPCGASGHKSLSVSPISLITGNRLLSASMTFPVFQVPTGRVKQLLIREGRGCKTWEKNSLGKQWCCLGAKSWFPIKGLTRQSLSCFADRETPPGGRSYQLKRTLMHETSAQPWCTGKTQRNRVEREVGGGIGMGNTCKSIADSCQYMTKTTTIL